MDIKVGQLIRINKKSPYKQCVGLICRIETVYPNGRAPRIIPLSGAWPDGILSGKEPWAWSTTYFEPLG